MRDRAAVHVHLLVVEAELADDREALRRERLVQLDEVEVADGRAPVRSSSLRHGRHRPDPHHARVDARDRTADEPAERLDAQSSRARSSLAITSAAAPSLTPLALPAVTVPPSRNTGLSAASFSAVVSGRGCSSRVDARRRRRARRRSGPRPPRPPSAAASEARTRPGPRARRPSARRRSRPSRPSTRAGTAPRVAGSGSASRASCRMRRSPRVTPTSGFACTSGARLIDSTPPATKRSPSPAAIACDAATTAESPDAHSRFTVTPATDSGRPGEQDRHARDVAVVLARLVGGAEIDVLDRPPGTPARSTASRDHASRRDRPAGRQPEHRRLAPDRRADSGEDDGAAHDSTNSTRTGCSYVPVSSARRSSSSTACRPSSP